MKKYLDNENLDVVILTAQILTNQKLYIFDKEKITNTNNKNFSKFSFKSINDGRNKDYLNIKIKKNKQEKYNYKGK